MADPLLVGIESKVKRKPLPVKWTDLETGVSGPQSAHRLGDASDTHATGGDVREHGLHEPLLKLSCLPPRPFRRLTAAWAARK